MRRALLLMCLLVAGAAAAWARPFIILSYNVENLFDADGKAQFLDYQPAAYSRHQVLTKLENITRVVKRFEYGRGPDILMFAEIETDQTPGKTPPNYDAILDRYSHLTIREMLGPKIDAAIADLPAEALLLKAFADAGMSGYHVVPGRDLRLPGDRSMAQKCVVFTRFPVLHAVSHPTRNARPILEVQLDVDGAKLYLFDNHWKSGASDPKTEKDRVANARTLRQRLDEIFAADPHADVVLAGDFNSQYNQNHRYPKMKQTGLNDVLKSQGNELALRSKARDLYNLWFELPPEERGSDIYRGEWGTLMQMILSEGLYDFRGVQYVDNSFAVAKIPGLNADTFGLPIRWSFDGPGGRGFSDHFPIYAKFLTVPNKQPYRYISLNNPSDDTGLSSVRKVDYGKIDLARVAFDASRLPPGETLRREAFLGELVKVSGEIAPGRRLAVVFRHDIYDLWSFDITLRDALRERFETGEPITFYGEVNQYKERWQFIIRDRSWVEWNP